MRKLSEIVALLPFVLISQQAFAGTSPSGTILPPAPLITDSNGTEWTIINSSVAENGQIDKSTSAVTTILYYNGEIYFLTKYGFWWNSALQRVPEDPREMVSPNGTTVSSDWTIVDASGNRWTISDGSIAKNGNVETSTNGVDLILYYNGVVYYKTTYGYWWNAETGKSVPSGDPRDTTTVPPNPTLTPMPTATLVPPNAINGFTPPTANCAASNYDRFYETEPGVYAYWALCEPRIPMPSPSPSSIPQPMLYDYVGTYDLGPHSQVTTLSWGGFVAGGAAGPIADGETATQVASSGAFMKSQNMAVNPHQGSLAVWVNSNATHYGASALGLSAVTGKSSVDIVVTPSTTAGQICYNAIYTNTTSVATTVTQCGYVVNTWHRVVMTWDDSPNALSLYVDGILVGTKTFTPTLDNLPFYFQLFPGNSLDTLYGNSAVSAQMTLAKASVANQAWSSAQISLDFKPTSTFITPPTAGVYVTTQKLGTIHKDILGVADYGTNVTDPTVLANLKKGLQKIGVSSFRYASGAGGIGADWQNWQPGPSCTSSPGVLVHPSPAPTATPLDVFEENVIQPLHLDLGYTVNYGTNPTACNGGGDPTINGADLVNYANNTKKYGIKYFEIGNEDYDVGKGALESDFHPQSTPSPYPAGLSTYPTYEPAFYDKMKAEDSTIQIGIPAANGIWSWMRNFTLPSLAGAKYDALVYHNYPVSDTITDGSTLYQDRVASNMGNTRGQILTYQTELLSQGKSPDSIWVTEWDGEVGGGKWSRQTMGAVAPLFAAMELGEYMRAGVPYATWWMEGSGANCMTGEANMDYQGGTAYSWYNCGHTMLVFTGPPAGGTTPSVDVGLKPGDITPPGRGMQVIGESGFVTEGERIVETVTDQKNAPWLLTYAATHGTSYAIIMINRDRDTAHKVPVQFANKTSGGYVRQYTYGRAQYDQQYYGNWSVDPFQYVDSPWTGTFSANLPPWSVSVFIFSN